MPRPRFSIITAVYDDPRVERAVRSVLSQQVPFGVESVVVDGRSTDPATLAALETCEALGARVFREPDQGIYDAMNKGLGHAQGEVVGILNADDRYSDEGVLADVDRAMRDAATPLAYGDLVYEDAEGRPVRVWRSGPVGPWSWHLGWMPPHPTFFVARDVYERCGGFDLGFGTAADYELMHRLMVREGLEAAYVQRELVRMAVGGASAGWRSVLRANLNVHRVWRRDSLAASLVVPVLKPLSKAGQWLSALLHRAGARA